MRNRLFNILPVLIVLATIMCLGRFEEYSALDEATAEIECPGRF